jgi:2-polyprenyl-3-methyl-5-hydroxy-6-metoxy-1,4-benzoquinol methylase
MNEQTIVTGISDETGLETLEIFAGLNKFNSWLFETIAPYCKDDLLEIGSGIGNISELLLQKFISVTLSDLRTEYCQILQKKFGSNNHLKNIYAIDLAENAFENKYASLQNGFDTIVASNIIEHIQDDRQAIKNSRSMLKKNGRLIVLVPAYNILYNGFDKELGHFHRYTKNSLSKLFNNEGFDVVHTQYFNFMAIFGWWFSGSVLKKKILPRNQLVLYNKLIPLIKLADRIMMNQIGLSVIAVGEKK